MQGWSKFIATELKTEYINALLEVGFDTIDFGSFVSAKAIPQMADTKDVLKGLRLGGKTKLLAIVANFRGAEDAAAFEEIHYLGFPFSISETFQQRNTHSSIAESFDRVKQIQELCTTKGKELVVYISMGFGNPYADDYSKDVVFDWASQLSGLGIRTISLADTVGLATPDLVEDVTGSLIKQLPDVEIGVHLHSTPSNLEAKLGAVYNAGCQRYDGALKGIGGCPMAGNELVGNMDTERMIAYLQKQGLNLSLNEAALEKSVALANRIFT